jgi:hypothetical protein
VLRFVACHTSAERLTVADDEPQQAAKSGR